MVLSQQKGDDSLDGEFTLLQEDDFDYNVLSDDTVELTKYRYDWTYYKGRNVEIPGRIKNYRVVAIQSDCFCNDTIWQIKIPNTVTRLEKGAFFCVHLKSMTIPNTLTQINGNPFRAPFDLSQINVSSTHPTLAVIDGTLFDKSEKRLIIIPEEGTEGDYAIPYGIKTIEHHSFNCCKFSNIIIPESVTTINDYAFSNCVNITRFDIPHSVTYIGEGACFRCLGLKKIAIPNSVTFIGEKLFLECKGVVAEVQSGSYAEKYCKTHKIKHISKKAPDWLIKKTDERSK